MQYTLTKEENNKIKIQRVNSKESNPKIQIEIRNKKGEI
jgi:hypothetical protein